MPHWPAATGTNGTPVAYRLIDDVSGLQIRYLAQDNTWRERWPAEPFTGLPKAVNIKLTLLDGGTIERLVALP